MGCVPPHTQRFHGEIFDTPPLCGGEVHYTKPRDMAKIRCDKKWKLKIGGQKRS
jgi:hypothetical protein